MHTYYSTYAMYILYFTLKLDKNHNYMDKNVGYHLKDTTVYNVWVVTVQCNHKNNLIVK